MEEKVTWKVACETIARYFNETKGINISGEEIFNYSPTGELSTIPFLYKEAKLYFEIKD